ncbi:MAG: hypothetical protein AMJ53_05195 [Gammaproteobacteria bacterium SG8_11]|nr:MAG: hypothetical protein AMJ53_05195 [Gammaproteobacteria bacterium SG8_11]
MIAGINARMDISRGVHKAPANVVKLGISGLSKNVSQREQEILNPGNINSLCFLEDRGTLVWGARILSADPKWKYINIRRLFIFLEQSIDRGTQWVVFEPNTEET